MPQKRTLEAFFGSTFKRPRTQASQVDDDETVTAAPVQGQALASSRATQAGRSHHVQYPFPIANLPPSWSNDMLSLPAQSGRSVTDQPDLDLLCFEPYVPGYLARNLFEFLRSELPFYRVEYDIKRGGIQTHIHTPRWTTVFGLDETSHFDKSGCIMDKMTGMKAADKRYDRCPPRPIPQCLDDIRKSTEDATGCTFNFCLVNYYASGSDSISFHSDDERFLGKDPAVASFSFGARRDFLLKHKPPPKNAHSGSTPSARPLKFSLGSGDMVLMRGKTQSNWLHSVPKRTGRNQEDGGRINLTFRRAMVKDGTENYYKYNVGGGPVYRWDEQSRQMTVWKPGGHADTAKHPAPAIE